MKFNKTESHLLGMAAYCEAINEYWSIKSFGLGGVKTTNAADKLRDAGLMTMHRVKEGKLELRLTDAGRKIAEAL